MLGWLLCSLASSDRTGCSRRWQVRVSGKSEEEQALIVAQSGAPNRSRSNDRYYNDMEGVEVDTVH